MVALTCLATLVSAAELVAVRGELGAGGVFDWTILRTGRVRTAAGALATMLDTLLRPPGPLAILAVQLVASGLVLANPAPRLVLLWLAILLGCHLLTLLQLGYGSDASDRMVTVLLTGGVCFYAAPPGIAKDASLWYVGGQAALAYFTSGWFKLRSPLWRSGQAVAGILRTRTFGNSVLAEAVARRPGLSRLLSWWVIAFECSVVVLLLLGPGGWQVFAAVGLVFHICVAMVMGLNHFLWSFVSTYPAMLYLADGLSGGTRNLIF